MGEAVVDPAPVRARGRPVVAGRRVRLRPYLTAILARCTGLIARGGERTLWGEERRETGVIAIIIPAHAADTHARFES